MQYLPVELINIIKSSLDRLSLHHFSHACKTLFDKYDTYIMNKINVRLEKIFGDKLPDLKKLMQKLGCVISGSFVLQCMLDEEWKGSDIDFYVPMRSGTIRCYKNDLDTFMCTIMGFYDGIAGGYEDYSDQHKIKWVRTFSHMATTMNGLRTPIQIISIDVDNNYEAMYHFINKTFDFNICKNMYYCDGKDRIRARNFTEVFLKKTSFTLPRGRMRNVWSAVRRREKYIERGIKIEAPKFESMSHMKLSDFRAGTLFGDNIFPKDVVYHIFGNIKELRKLNRNQLSDIEQSDRESAKCYRNGFGETVWYSPCRSRSCDLCPFGGKIGGFFGTDVDHYHKFVDYGPHSRKPVRHEFIVFLCSKKIDK